METSSSKSHAYKVRATCTFQHQSCCTAGWARSTHGPPGWEQEDLGGRVAIMMWWSQIIGNSVPPSLLRTDGTVWVLFQVCWTPRAMHLLEKLWFCLAPPSLLKSWPFPSQCSTGRLALRFWFTSFGMGRTHWRARTKNSVAGPVFFWTRWSVATFP